MPEQNLHRHRETATQNQPSGFGERLSFLNWHVDQSLFFNLLPIDPATTFLPDREIVKVGTRRKKQVMFLRTTQTL
jgi:hypothetical protein